MPPSPQIVASFPHLPGYLVQRSHAHRKNCNLLPCASPQFRQAAQQGVGSCGDQLPGNALQDAVLSSPGGAFLDPLFDVLVQGLDLAIEELQTDVEALADRPDVNWANTDPLGLHLHH